MVEDILEMYEHPQDPSEIEAVRIKLASPERIREWSRGEVKKPETINYRTFKPEKDGLFCARIFGPVRDWECLCGKYKKIKHRGIVCDKCGVEVTSSKVRRERMGHIELATPVAHIWYVKVLPSKIGTLLGLSVKDLERIIYYESYIVVDPGDTPLKEKEILSEARYKVLREQFGDAFDARMGAEAIRDLLKKIDLRQLEEELKAELKRTHSAQTAKDIIKRLRLVQAFIESGNRPEWMILEVIPVIPPDLRPLVPLDGGRFATSDLNDLYRRVINRNNRLKRLLELKAPDIIIRNEKRMLQEAVDALFDNGRMARPIKGSNGRPLKSLSDTLRGKQGRFRQNLLGKRVDYSGRSVIVVGPELKLNQCGLPKIMALELFKPFIMHKLIYEKQVAPTLKKAKMLVEQQVPEVWDALDEVVKEHPVMLNRAPTLHRPSIQAFEPILVEEKAIKIHPLVCVPYNADFDGDQMAVHVPLSLEAQTECHTQIMANHHILSPAHGKPLNYPTQDMVLGLYYLSKPRAKAKGEGKVFSSPEEVRIAYEEGAVHLQARIKVRINGKLYDTTVGRVLFYLIVPPVIKFEEVDRVLTKKVLQNLVFEVVKRGGNSVAVEFLDRLKDMGFELATRSAISISIDDLEVPPTKEEIVEEAFRKVMEVEEEFRSGRITRGEKYNKNIAIWSEATDRVTSDLLEMLKKKDEEIMNENGFNPDGTPKDFNSIYIMADSGARGGTRQIHQLAGMRGLMAKPSGDIIETPITSNFREGLSVLQYFVSTHGARKGLADTALKTANAGYLTRKLVDVAHHEIVVEEDCGTVEGIYVEPLFEGGKIYETLADRIVGRVALEDIKDPFADDEDAYIVRAGEIIDEEKAKRIEEAGIKRVGIRSVLTCESRYGVCQKCYGWDLSRRRLVDIGEAVGIIAAQSIGEPGTQLTMRTFHIGGTATVSEVSQYEAKTQGFVKYVNLKVITNREGELIVLNRDGEIKVVDEKGKEKESYPVAYGAVLMVKDGQEVKPGQILLKWDPYNTPFITEVPGRVKFGDVIEGVTMKEEIDEATGMVYRKITESKDEKRNPRLSIKAGYRESEIAGKVRFENVEAEEENGELVVKNDGAKILVVGEDEVKEYHIPKGAILKVRDRDVVDPGQDLAWWIPAENEKRVKTIGRYPLSAGTYIMVREGDVVYPGDLIAKIPRELAKTKDITGGLPKVVQLFEARRPKEKAIISEINGFVEVGSPVRGKIKVTIKGEGETREYLVPQARALIVKTGDYVRAGERLVEGDIDPHDLLEVLSIQKVRTYLVDEIQKIYRSQGVDINDRHIELIVRQMLKKVRIEDPGDTKFLPGDEVDKFEFEEENRRVLADGGKPATAKPILVGIAKAAVQSESWISAASFQETTRVLADAAVRGKIDYLRGLKENVIVGRLIPAGTGMRLYRDTEIKVPLIAEEKAEEPLDS